MAFINYDEKENSISLFRGISHFYDKTIIHEEKEHYSEIYEEKKGFKGIKLKNFLPPLEKKGFKAEILFKNLLEKNSIPSLYVGQGPEGIQKSNTLIKKTNSRRPDFLVNLPNLGTTFFDVKCRKRIGFQIGEENFFQLFISEVEGLINLHKQLLIPVWVVFVDESEVYKEGIEHVFHLVPITLLKKLKEQLFAKFEKNEKNSIAALRIPSQILTRIKKELVFKAGIKSINEEIILDFSKKYQGFFRIIEDKLKDTIRNNKILKSKIAKKLKDDIIKFAFIPEIDKVLENMIKNKIIIYEPQKPLKLLGE